jgi:CDP-glycerol glycerophosphotransferase (TagB/SpsB family)
MVFFAYDYEDYVRDERGTYVDLPDIAPGPVVGTNEELIEALLAVDKNVAVYADRYDAFRDRFCTYETGHAAEDVVERFLGRRGES